MDKQVARNIEVQEPNVIYATFNRRSIAATIDLICLTFLFYPVTFIMVKFLYGDRSLEIIKTIPETYQNGSASAALESFNLLIANQFILKYILVQLVTITLIGVVIVFAWFKMGTTPGKFLTECKILDAATLNEPTRGQYLRRFFGYFFSGLPLCLGFLAIYLDKRNRAWHDRFASTVVVVRPHNWRRFKEVVDNVWRRIQTRFAGLK